MTHCEYWDAGWCYSPKGVKNNASSSGACLDSKNCPHLITKECRQTGRTNATTNKLLKLSEPQMDEPVKYETTMTATEDLKAQIKVLTAKLALFEEMDKYKTPCEEVYKRVYGAYPMGEPFWIVFEKGYDASQEDYKEVENEIEKLQEKNWYVDTKTILKPNWEPKPQTPEQIEKSLRETFKKVQQTEEWKETQRQIDSNYDELVKNPPEFLKFKLGKTLEGLIEVWWCDVFTRNNDLSMEESIDRLVTMICYWLPKEQSAAGSQSLGVEDMVEGFNDCLKKIKSKLR